MPFQGSGTTRRFWVGKFLSKHHLSASFCIRLSSFCINSISFCPSAASILSPEPMQPRLPFSVLGEKSVLLNPYSVLIMSNAKEIINFGLIIVFLFLLKCILLGSTLWRPFHSAFFYSIVFYSVALLPCWYILAVYRFARPLLRCSNKNIVNIFD